MIRHEELQQVADGGHHMIERAQAYAEMLLGLTLFSYQFWHQLIVAVSEGAHYVTEIGGGVITVHGLWRVYRHHRPKNPKPGQGGDA